VVKRSYFHYF